MNLPPNVQLRKEKAQATEGQKKTISKLVVKFNFDNNLWVTCYSPGIEYELNHLIDFEVSHNLFKGHLLVPHQIKATSRKRELVDEVKHYFDRWLQQISICLIQGTVLWIASKREIDFSRTN